jgi:polyisoprenoid-binding protein YceI
MEFELVPFHSTVTFSVPFMGLTSVKGGFEEFSGLLLYDPVRPSGSSVTFVIQTASLHTGSSLRDRHLRSDDFLDVERHPTIRYQSDSLLPRGRGRYEAYGRLTLRGVTRPVVLPVRLRHGLVLDRDGVDYLGFDIVTRLDWRSFGVPATNRNNGWFQPAKMLVNDSVDITLSMEAARRRASRIHYPALDTLMAILGTRGIEAVRRRYAEVRTLGPDSLGRFVAPFADAGRALADRGRADEGVALLQLRLDAAPSDADAMAELARAQLAAGDSIAAIRLYREAVGKDSTRAAALEMLRHLAPAQERAP